MRLRPAAEESAPKEIPYNPVAKPTTRDMEITFDLEGFNLEKS